MVAESREQEEEAFVESRKSNFGAQFDDFQGKFFLATHMLLYSAETWNMTLVNRKKLEAAHRRWLRKILRISWVDRVTNEEVRWRTGQESLETIIRRRRLRWFGHIHRMSSSRLAHQALDCTPPIFRKKPGQPRKSWKLTIKEDLTLLGLTWDEAKEEVEDREEWRCHVARCATRACGWTKV